MTGCAKMFIPFFALHTFYARSGCCMKSILVLQVKCCMNVVIDLYWCSIHIVYIESFIGRSFIIACSPNAWKESFKWITETARQWEVYWNLMKVVARRWLNDTKNISEKVKKNVVFFLIIPIWKYLKVI